MHKASIMGNKETLNFVIKFNKSPLPTITTNFIAMEKILWNKCLNWMAVLVEIKHCGVL